MIKAGIVGATGYAGAELVRLLASHPQARVEAVSSVSYEGKKLSDVYPNLYGICDLVLTGADEVVEKCDVVFASLPHGLSEELAGKCLAAGKKTIDLGADFRLNSESEYAEWYGKSYKRPDLHEKALYCIPELHRFAYRGQPIIGNPGCYPTSVALGAAPLFEACIAEKSMVIDSKSGVTGSGRGLTDTTHFPNCNEAFSAYKAAAHRHTPEIEQTLSALAGDKVTVTFVPHLLPVNRGIETTMYVGLTAPCTAEELHKLYSDRYRGEKFVRVLPLGRAANIRDVRMSNYCDIGIFADPRTGRAVITSAIDNMVKGAAGQAIQNMNIMFSIEEDCGLDFVPPAF